MRASESPVLGVGLVVLAICSVQLGAAVGKSVFDQISPAGLTLLRLVLAAAVMLLIARPRLSGWKWATWRPVLVLGATLGSMNLLYYASLATIPLSVAVTCELMGPLVLALVLSRRLVEAGWVLLAGLGVGIIGVRSWQGELDPVGVLLALAAGGCWAVYILASQRVGAVVPGLGGLSAAMVVGAIVALPFGAAPAASAIAADPAVIAPALVIALLSSVLAYGLEMLALRRIPSRVFGVLMSLEPAAAALFGFLLLREALGVWDAIAIALVAAASAGVTITAARARRPRDGTPPTDTGTLPQIVS